MLMLLLSAQSTAQGEKQSWTQKQACVHMHAFAHTHTVVATVTVNLNELPEELICVDEFPYPTQRKGECVSTSLLLLTGCSLFMSVYHTPKKNPLQYDKQGEGGRQIDCKALTRRQSNLKDEMQVHLLRFSLCHV